MSSDKTAVRYGVKIAKESVYKTFVAPSDADDGVLVVAEPLPSDDYKYPGTTDAVYGSTAGTRNLPPSGRWSTTPIVQEVTPAPAAYDASFDADSRISIHRILELNGYVASFDAAGGPNGVPRHKYLPLLDPGAAGGVQYASGSSRILTARQQYDLTGSYVGSVEISADGIGMPLRMTAQLQGTIDTEPDDISAYPTIVYPHYNKVPFRLLNPEILALPGYTTLTGLRMKSFKFTSTRELSERGADHGGLHAGWTVGQWRQELEVTMEARAISAGNPRAARALGSFGALSVCFGGLTVAPFTGAGSRLEFSTGGSPRAQVVEFAEARDGKTVLWTSKYLFIPSTLDGNDGLTIAGH